MYDFVGISFVREKNNICACKQRLSIDHFTHDFFSLELKSALLYRFYSYKYSELFFVVVMFHKMHLQNKT